MKINDLFESPQICPECGGLAFSDLLLAEKKDACYSKVRSRYKVWPSAYASGALVQCRKKGAANWGNKSKNEGVAEAFGPLPRDNQQIRLGRHTVNIERVGEDKNFIGFAWHDSKGQDHYEEVSVGDLGSYDDLIDRIKQEISYQERQYTDQGVAEGSEWETRHDEFTTVGDRATPEQINKIVSALGVAAKQASGKRGFLNKIVGKQSNGDLARMAHSAETLAKNIQRNSNAKPGTDERKELGQHLVYAVSLLKRIKGEKGVAEGLLDEAVGGNYLYHATSPAGLKGILQSGYIGAQQTAQPATDAQTKLPTVAVTRDWNYASGSARSSEGVGQGAVIVLDRNSIESKYKTFGSSQSWMTKGLPNASADTPQMKKLGIQVRARDANKNNKLDYNEVPAGAGGDALKKAYFQPKAGGEAEEAVIVPKGTLPLQGSMVGFWVDPKSELAKDPTIINDPRRLDMVRPNQFVKAKQAQGVAEGSNDTIYPNAEVIKSKNGKPVGEIYQDGNSWGAFHYRADRGYDLIDSREDAIEALRELHQETGRSGPDYTIKGVAEGSVNDYFKRRKDEEDRIAGTKAPAKRTPQQTDYAKRRAQEKKVEQGVAENNNEKIGGRYDPDEFDAMVARVKKLAGQGPMKTVYDPQKRVYRNVPTAVQPKK